MDGILKSQKLPCRYSK